MLRVNLGLDYEDPNQAGMFNKYKFHFGFDINLVKLYKRRKFKLVFRWNDTALLYIKYDNDEDRQALQNLFGIQTSGKDGYLKTREVKLSGDDYNNVLTMYINALQAL